MTAMVVMNEGTFLISTDRAKLDLDVIHGFLRALVLGGGNSARDGRALD